MVAQVTLTAALIGPYPTAGDLDDANESGPGQSRIAATAPVIKVSTVSLSGLVSVLTIPRSAAPGYYSIWSTAAAEGMSKSGGTTITVS